MVATFGLGKRYGKSWAVQDLWLAMDQGEVLCLLGPNGAGKSTTISMIAGAVASRCAEGFVGDMEMVEGLNRLLVAVLVQTLAAFACPMLERSALLLVCYQCSVHFGLGVSCPDYRRILIYCTSSEPICRYPIQLLGV